MSRVDQVIYVLLGLVIVMLIGMVTGSWRFVLYPFLLVIGLAIFMGLIKDIERNPRKIWIPVSVSVIYFILYIAHDLITLNSPTGGTGFVFGLTPAMALYFFGIWPLAVLVCLLYVITFSIQPKQKKDHQTEKTKINMEG